MADYRLNERAGILAQFLLPDADRLRIAVTSVAESRIIDAGIQAEGGLEAGIALARLCSGDLLHVQLVPGQLAGRGWTLVSVNSDHPLAACLFSQYAGWQLAVGKYFAMGSGPMRAAAAREELFQQFNYRESSASLVGVLEGRKLPTPEVIAEIAGKTGVEPSQITLAIAPTASAAGNLQVVARVVETALHKLHEVGFDVTRIRSASGFAPLSPVAKDDLTAIGRTNDAILYGGRVTLWVRGDDESIAEIGPKVPANGSAAYGQPFIKIFEAAGRDFYKIDPHLFSPAEITFQNLDTGRVQTFGRIDEGVLQDSFGL